MNGESGDQISDHHLCVCRVGHTLKAQGKKCRICSKYPVSHSRSRFHIFLKWSHLLLSCKLVITPLKDINPFRNSSHPSALKYNPFPLPCRTKAAHNSQKTLDLSNLHDPLSFQPFWLQVNLSNKFYNQKYPFPDLCLKNYNIKHKQLPGYGL